MRIKAGDKVVVISGKAIDKDKTGKVLKVLPEEDRVIVENVNMVTAHEKPMGPTQPGGIVEYEGPIHVSNVMPYCDSCKQGVRVKMELDNEGKKTGVRLCHKCGKKLG